MKLLPQVVLVEGLLPTDIFDAILVAARLAVNTVSGRAVGDIVDAQVDVGGGSLLLRGRGLLGSLSWLVCVLKRISFIDLISLIALLLRCLLLILGII